MKEYPQSIKFKYNWRHYQKKVLDELEAHLDDNHLHIIAPPGSGKTVLGLEVAIRLNKPTIIFAPTVAIKNQWIQRFCELFLQTQDRPDWISNDLKNPKFLTVSTYQALHAACTNSVAEETDTVDDECESNETGNGTKKIDSTEIVHLFKAQKIGTIVVDEAHHLKNEWWKSLSAIKDALNPTIVGLTATPPYDVSYSEWQRYIDLNGPVDAEISVPELVVENDLCPHQDYIFLSEPTIDENLIINQYRQKAHDLFEEIKKDEVLIEAIVNHPTYQFPEKNLEWIYDNLEYYSAIIIFLNASDKIIKDKNLEVIGAKKFKIPQLSFEWIEKLLNFYLFIDKENFISYEDHKERLINKLSRNGIIERKSVCFGYNQSINKLLSTSLSKLKSIDEIVNQEHNSLKEDLRMVILTDYIRKEFLVNGCENNLEINKIGVVPVFEKLRRNNDRNLKLGILSGSLIIIPQSALVSLQQAAKKFQISEITYTVLPYDSRYSIVNTTEKHDIVHLVTNIFEQGEIQVLIGTKSLLGEGWDAPKINSLILASFVGSYVLSNQMRGRAIRSDRNNPEKTGNIWHLVCVDHTTPDGGDDIQILKRRFRGFVGISFKREVNIENGTSRLNLPEIYHTNIISDFNANMLKCSSRRDLLKQKWSEALKKGVSLTEEIKVPFPRDKDIKSITSMYYYKTIANSLAMLGSALLTFSESILQGLLRSMRNIKSPEDLFRWLMIIGMIGLVVFGRQFYKTFRLFFKYRDISTDFRQIGEALLETLVKIGVIQTEYSKLHVISTVDDYGAIYCHLEGGTTYEKSTFIKSLQEIIGTVDNPRYIIIRKNTFLKIISQKDYHTVPELIGQNKKGAECFERQWGRFVGSCRLVYTRTIEGRKILLKSRIHSLSSEFEDRSERINMWR